MQNQARQTGVSHAGPRPRRPKPTTLQRHPREDVSLINSLAAKLIRDEQPPVSTQQSIPYRQMYWDGICRLDDKRYTKTIAFEDINYKLASNEVKKGIFELYCEFLNYFDSSFFFQITVVVQRIDKLTYEKMIAIPPRMDSRDDIRAEFTGILKNQLSKGNNGLRMVKYLTFGAEFDSREKAKPGLERMETDILNNYRSLGVKARSLSGEERLNVLHDILNPDDIGRFRFSWKHLVEHGLSTKDYIAPPSLDFRERNVFRTGGTYGTVSYLHVDASELPDDILTKFLACDNPVVINLHIRSINQARAIKNVKSTLTDLDKMKIDAEQKAFHSGYLAALPPDLKTFGVEAENMLKDLQTRNERMFLTDITVMHTAKTRQKLNENVFAARGVAQTYNCDLKQLDYRQEQGFMGVLPLGENQINNQRGYTTSSLAVFMPFSTQELFQNKEALYYGLNALSNNLIMANRKLLKNPNGLILGTPGSGKSFAAKREMVNVFLVTGDDIIVTDPESEYYPLISELGGLVIKLSTTSKHYINPMDINLGYGDGDDPLRLKSEFILSLFEQIMGGETGLDALEKSVIDSNLRRVYHRYLADPRPENMPVLGDLYDLLLEQAETHNDTTARNIAVALDIYVNGSFNVFNNRTNVDINNRLVCFDIKDLGSNLKPIGMLILQDQVWNRVTINRAAKKTTWFFQDEFHLMLRDKQTAAYSIEIWKRFRKWGGVPTAITQNIKDFLKSASAAVENIFENSDFVMMLNQGPGDREILGGKLGISSSQLKYVEQAGAGEGLVIYGGTVIPFVDRFPTDTKLYRIMTTKPDEVS